MFRRPIRKSEGAKLKFAWKRGARHECRFINRKITKIWNIGTPLNPIEWREQKKLNFTGLTSFIEQNKTYEKRASKA